MTERQELTHLNLQVANLQFWADNLKMDDWKERVGRFEDEDIIDRVGMLEHRLDKDPLKERHCVPSLADLADRVDIIEKFLRKHTAPDKPPMGSWSACALNLPRQDDELLPCPFCGEDPECSVGINIATVVCHTCGIRIHRGTDYKDARAEWNKRHIPELIAAREEIERLQKFADWHEAVVIETEKKLGILSDTLQRKTTQYEGTIAYLEDERDGLKETIRAADNILETYKPVNNGPSLHDRVFAVTEELEAEQDKLKKDNEIVLTDGTKEVCLNAKAYILDIISYLREQGIYDGGALSSLTRLKAERDKLKETIRAVEYELDHPNDEMQSVIGRALKIITDTKEK